MKSTTPLTGSHRRTYDTIFQHPVSHNLGWRDVHALFRHLGEIEEESNGNLKVMRNGHVLVLHAPRTKDVAETTELMALRHFLELSETAVPNGERPVAQWLVVIDHHEARIYRSVAVGAVPQQIRPHAGDEFSRHSPQAAELSRDREAFHPNRFFEPVAAVLNGAGEILIFGSGTGASSEMEQFTAWLKQRRPEVARRIVGSVVIDERHLSEAQVLAHAREIYAKPASAT
jgi:hypothetical protein